MFGLTKLMRRDLGLREPAPLRVATMQREHREWIEAVIDGSSPTEVKSALAAAGFLADPGGSGLVQKPGACEQCRQPAFLQRGLDSGRWLCHKCSQDELCSS